MGTLVFQATLGGAINLVGPNTASTVNFTLPSADGTNGQFLSTNGSGTLSFATVTPSQWTTTGSDIYYNTGNVGIGTSSPDQPLVVNKASGSNYLKISGANNAAYDIGLQFTDGTNQSYFGQLRGTLSGTAGALVSVTGGAIRTVLDSSGTFKTSSTISVGNATPSSSGAGITFPATQSASSDANTLDDYEEGTWTPSLGGNATYSLVNGNYVKVGRLVYAVASINMSSIGSGSTTTITGLPFTNGASGECNVSVGYLTGSATSISSLTGYVSNGGTSIVLQSFAAGGGTSTAANGIFANSTQIRFQAVYYANT